MKITVIAAGKLKERFYQEAVEEYRKRLSRYLAISIIEVADGPDMEAEAGRIIKKIPEDACVVSLEIQGEQFDSEGFAEKIEELQVNGISRIAFLIGGSDGLSPSVTSRAALHMSFSKMTFPHMLMRVILLEQIYRAVKIIHNEPYHK